MFYHTNADDLSGPYVPGGVNLKAQNLETLYAAYVRRLSEHFVFELALGWPPLTKTVGQGPATLGSVPFNNQVISTARWFAPTALLNYQFFDDSAKLRPYIGIGVNYVNFYDRDSTAAGDAASGGPTKISLAPSVGPAYGRPGLPPGPALGLVRLLRHRPRRYAAFRLHGRRGADHAHQFWSAVADPLGGLFVLSWEPVCVFHQASLPCAK